MNNIYNRYIWLLHTVYQERKVTFERLCDIWMHHFLYNGKPLSLRTFHHHRKMIEENLFDKIKDFNLSFICMANPDGIDLERGEIKSFSKFQQRKLLKINNGSKDFLLWKANARGVDLNNNFDAKEYTPRKMANFAL